MNGNAVVDALVEVAPTEIESCAKRRNRCILATRIGLAVLEYFQIPAKEIPCETIAMNPAAYEWECSESPEPPPPEADALAVVVTMSPTEEERRQKDIEDPSGWWGHLAIMAEPIDVPAPILIDLDVQQFSRPHRNLIVPPAAAMVWTGEPDTWQAYAAAINGEKTGSVMIYRTKPGVTSYKRGDWLHRRLLSTGPARTAVRNIINKMKTVL